MPRIIIKPHEQIDSALRRFRRICEKDNTLKDFMKHEFYETDSETKVIARKNAIKREKKRNKQ